MAGLSREDVLERIKTGASLKGMDLSWADLSQMDLRGADLSGAVLTGAKLDGARLDEGNLSDVFAADASFKGRAWRGFPGDRAFFQRADFSGANLARAKMRRAEFLLVNGRGAVFREGDFTGARFIDSDLEGADLRGAVLEEANLRGVNLSGCDLSASRLVNADMRKTKTLGAAFDGVDARGALFYGKPPGTARDRIGTGTRCSRGRRKTRVRSFEFGVSSCRSSKPETRSPKPETQSPRIPHPRRDAVDREVDGLLEKAALLPRPPAAAQTVQERHLDVVDRVDEGIADLDRSLEPGIAREERPASGDGAQHPDRRSVLILDDSRVAAAKARIGHESDIPPGDVGVGLGERHLEVVDQVAEKRPAAIHLPEKGAVSLVSTGRRPPARFRPDTRR